MASLIASADEAEQCAQVFLRFKEFLPSTSGTHITSVVTALFSLSTSLQRYRRALEDPKLERYISIVAKDHQIVLKSINKTLTAVQRCLAPLEEAHERGLGTEQRKQKSYRTAWTTIQDYFANEGSRIQGCDSLTARLGTYGDFVNDLLAKLEGDQTSRQFKDLRFRMDKLLAIQEKKSDEETLDSKMERLAVADSAIPSFKKQSSWERRRPGKGKARIEGSRPVGNRVEQRLVRRNRITSQNLASDSDREYDYDLAEDLIDSDDEYEDVGLGEPVDWEIPSEDEADIMQPLSPIQGRIRRRADGLSPFSPLRMDANGGYFVPAPDPPRAASSGTASPSLFDSSESTSELSDKHWLSVVFNHNRSSTLFRSTGSDSTCFGEHTPGISSALNTEYECLMKLPFEDGNMELRIFIRESDLRSRILIRQDRGTKRIQCSQAFTDLRILRRDSNLQLCTPDRKKRGQVLLWTQLNFPTYEKLVLFWCMFQALKAQDNGQPIRRLDDPILHGEVALFKAVIIDDLYQHAFHVLRDTDSKAIRLQASALNGELKRTPVWTAFITHQVMSNTWARRVEPRKVHLRELTRFIFSDDYEPQLGPRSEDELFFQRSEDAKAFCETIRSIAAGVI